MAFRNRHNKTLETESDHTFTEKVHVPHLNDNKT